jgi:hypothetical protein
VTRLHLRSNRYLVPFIVYSLRSLRQAKRAPGNVAATTYRDRHGGYWTKSIWHDAAAMKAFMVSGPHQAAMPKLLEWCDEAALTHWEQDSATPPAWPEARRRLQAEGRRSKVHHPSPQQDAFTIPPL